MFAMYDNDVEMIVVLNSGLWYLCEDSVHIKVYNITPNTGLSILCRRFPSYITPSEQFARGSHYKTSYSREYELSELLSNKHE